MTDLDYATAVPVSTVPISALPACRPRLAALPAAIRRLCAGSLALGGALLALPALAQDNPPVPTEGSMQRVEITGSSIRRIAAETSLPITSVRAEDFARQGLTTAQEVLNSIPMNQSSVSVSQAVGAGTGGQSEADLRGLGGKRTLVLLNGRRIASHPFNGDSVDLNVIPLSALDRVEVLRDGASAIYGSDAIGGVVNFITKRQVTGGALTVEAYQPELRGGGDERRLNLSGGFGDLASDRFNVFGVADVHRQHALPAIARPFSATGVIPSRGVSQTSGTPFPANFFSDNGISGNPGFASGCLPPASIPNTNPDSPTCRYDFTREVDDIPRTKQESYLGRFSYRLNDDNTLAAEVLHSRSTTEARVAPPPLAGIGVIMHGDSPYYPGGSAGVPAVAGLTGEDLDISWRPLVTGRRDDYSTSTSDRLVLSAEGTLRGWDYNVGLNHSLSQASIAFNGGYVIDQRIIDGVGSGLLNPFGDQSAAGLAYLQDSLLLGEYVRARLRSTAIDARASRELGHLPGGALGFALGGEARKEKALYTVNRALASQASSSGFADAQDQAGDRKIYAVFAELNAPVLSKLELNAAARYDHYNDVGHSFTPKLSARWQPVTPFLWRASWNRGFRAPTLFDLHGPQTVTNSSDPWDDPVLCPNGVVKPGANPNLSCEQQQNIRQGGNPDVKPERSKTYSTGVVLEPVRDVTLSFDYWNIHLRDQISALAEQTVFNDYAKYQDLFHYNAAGTRLDYVSLITNNLGEVKTSGVDTSLLWRMPRSRASNLTLQVDGTWVRNYDYQNERGGPFTVNVGRYADATPVFRWRTNASLQWNMGPWGATLTNRYMTGYTDQNAVDPQFAQNVKAYSVWSLSGSYSGIKHVDLTLGVKNLLDQDPPYTNQSTTFQQGYDPRYTDPLGRTYFARLTYKF